LYRATYHSKTIINNKVKYGSVGWRFNLGLNGPFSRQQLVDKINITESRTINLGVYTRIDIKAAYNGVYKNIPLNFKVNTGFNFYGLGSSSVKNAEVERLILNCINSSKKKLVKEIEKQLAKDSRQIKAYL
jgi:hypothetical protein